MHASLIHFRPYSSTHLAITAACAAAILILCLIGRARRRTPSELRLRRALGSLGLLFFIIHNVYWLAPANFTPARSLPFHLCDLAGVISPLALLVPARILRTLAYFWGFVLGLQGFFQPVITEGPATFIFWGFFLAHTFNVGCALYDVAVGGFAPTLRDVITAILASLLYLAVMLPFNIITGFNYGYVGPGAAAQPTLLDVLGPWPFRLLPMFLILCAAFLLAWAPWAIAARSRRAAPPTIRA
ncbi:MAG: TIGR02206 family membrane protein [Planctomycetota bacterium]|nr:TIGR02206 family membrane protein [Planctomycetota bacterium]